MTHKPISGRSFSAWALAVGLEGLLTTFILAREPSEAKSIVALGLSSQRLIIVTGCLLLAIFFIIVAIAHLYRLISWNRVINKKPNLLRYILIGTLMLELAVLHLLLLIPDYYSPTISGYLSRLEPVLIWFALIFAQTFILLAYFGHLSLENLKKWRDNQPIWIALVIIGLVWGLIAMTGIGITPDDLYWNTSGVPLLTWQVWIACGVNLVVWFLFIQLTEKRHFSRASSLAIFIGVWVITAIIWIKTPLTPTFNAPGPYPPSKEFYPFVDAALFDLGAQSALYGKGLFFGAFIDRGLLSGFLAVIHMLFGQNYRVVVGAQSAIFAVFPALLYFLGKKLHSNSAGVLVAMLATFKVSNAIFGGKFISTSHPKLMLTEFPTGIILVLFSLLLVLWLIESNSKRYYLAGIGASIGIGILLRHNVFFMFSVVLGLGIVVWNCHWKRALRDILLVVTAFFITISPWMWRNQKVAGEPLFFLSQFNRVIEERYQPQSYIGQDRVSNRYPRMLTDRTAISQIENENFIDLHEYQFIPKHFVHNLITSVLILPPSPMLDDFRHVIDNYPYWGRIENQGPGQLSASMGLFLAINLIILSVGFDSSWKRIGFIASVPLLVFLFYSFASAFARTSGGRYIVPVDWVIYFYYAIGLVEIIKFCISIIGFQTGSYFSGVFRFDDDKTDQNLSWKKTSFIILPFFLLVSALPVIELFSPGDKPQETTESLMQQLDEISFFDTSGLSRPDVEEFFSNPDALLISGRGFYPRYYSYYQGEPILPGQISVYTSRDYPRLVFTLLLPNMDKPVLLPIDESRLHFPDAAKVIVGGCQVGQSKVLTSYLNYIDAAFVVILDEPGEIYIRNPEAPLTCPLREPVCDNNHYCQ